MSVRIFIIEAESVDEARRKSGNSQTVLLEETILFHGNAADVKGIGKTLEEAFKRAETNVPPNAVNKKREIKAESKKIELQVKGAIEDFKPADESLTIESAVLYKKARKGFWGFFKRPAVYKVTIFQNFVVKIKFRQNARIRVTVCDYKAGDLLEIIEQRNICEWNDFQRILNPKNDGKIAQHLQEMQVAYLSKIDSAMNFIKTECRENYCGGWAETIEKARLKAIIARVKNRNENLSQENELRKIDVEIAQNFKFYTSIDWHRGKEPTGLPIEYDEHRIPPETSRKTIPKYSSNKADFAELERRIKDGFDFSEHYLKCLVKENLAEDTATLEQKCRAALEAEKLSRQLKY